MFVWMVGQVGACSPCARSGVLSCPGSGTGRGRGGARGQPWKLQAGVLKNKSIKKTFCVYPWGLSFGSVFVTDLGGAAVGF